MKKTMKVLAAAGLAAMGFAGMAAAQKFEIHSTCPLEAPEALKVFRGAKECLPGRGGTGDDANAARVEIRAVKRVPGKRPVIFALTPDGKSDEESNPLVLTTRIGAGVVGKKPGRFSVCVPNEAWAKVGTMSGDYVGFFARVYDAPTVADSVYYLDSDVVTNNPNLLYTNLVFKGEMKSISGDDLLDTDGDGISDQDEAELGTDYRLTDTDGDGLDDWQELMAGLDPTKALDEELPLPIITALTRRSDNPAVNAVVGDDSEMHVEGEWTLLETTNVTYSLEFVPELADWPENGGEGGMEVPLRTVSATNWANDITAWMTNGWGFLRVKRVIAIPEKSDYTQPIDEE